MKRKSKREESLLAKWKTKPYRDHWNQFWKSFDVWHIYYTVPLTPKTMLWAVALGDAEITYLDDNETFGGGDFFFRWIRPLKNRHFHYPEMDPTKKVTEEKGLKLRFSDKKWLELRKSERVLGRQPEVSPRKDLVCR